MDRYRSPQSLNAAALTIGSPRPLRPRAEDVIRSNAPLAHTPAMPTPQIPGRFEPPEEPHFESHIHEPQSYGPATMDISRPADAAYIDARTSTWSGRGLFGGIMSGLRRIPRALEKHHSRQSLYEEYMSEAQTAASARLSQTSPNQGLGDIQESVEGERTAVMESPPQGFSSQETYDDGTTAVHHDYPQQNILWPINSPAYTNSQLDSRTSKDESLLGPLPPDDTWAYYYACIMLFIRHIRNMPWSSHRIVNDYVPARDGRGHFGENRPSNVWYSRRKRRGDAEKATLSPPEVIVVPATPQGSYLSSNYGYGVAPVPLVVPAVTSPYSDGAVTAIRPTHTPMTATSAGIAYPSPGMSSHGMGRHDLSTSWYSSSPQQWRPWMSEVSSPQTRMTMGNEMYSSP